MSEGSSNAPRSSLPSGNEEESRKTTTTTGTISSASSIFPNTRSSPSSFNRHTIHQCVMEDYSDNDILQIMLSMNLVPRKNGTYGYNDTSLGDFSEMWYGVFMWAAVSSMIFHLPATLLAFVALRQHKMARLMPIAILLMGIVGPVGGGVLTSAAIAGVYKAAGKRMMSLEALVFGVGQSFFILLISFLRVLATL
ncbi:transmembrane protein 170A [Entelurus aequoreus]|uniref:transmembrane protein 170A n=1 Tax=Entelurus aequoreus TaxID=161455 RepID=UPI002B1D144D|nr:transmembrane protein 170A [Entelurus aequoreus]